MKKNKLLVIFMLFVLAMTLQGCSKVRESIVEFIDYFDDKKDDSTASDNSNSSEEENINKNPVYESAEEEIAFLVDAIERKDAQAIKDKFSPYAKSHIDDLDAKIDRFIQEFPGYGSDVEISDTFDRRSNYGKITYIMTPYFDYTVNGQGYCVRIVYYTESDEDETKLGWYSLQLFEYPNPDYSKEFYMHGYRDDPDILLWDYTKD